MAGSFIAGINVVHTPVVVRPCKGVSVRAYDMEEFVANQIAASTQYPAMAKQYADKWSKLTIPQRSQLLNETILTVTYDHENQEVSICF